MKIQLSNPIVVAHNPVTIEISDSGNAYVRAAFILDGGSIVQLDEPKTGSVTHVIGNLPNGTHKASFVVASTNAPMGGFYDTTLKINGVVVAHTSGTQALFTESDFVNFVIQV